MLATISKPANSNPWAPTPLATWGCRLLLTAATLASCSEPPIQQGAQGYAPLGQLQAALSDTASVSSPTHSPPGAPTDEGAYPLFDSLQVRPLALSPEGDLLFALNTPDNRLEVFEVGDEGLRPVASVTVGLEPVAVAVRSQTEVWVVNHLSDSVSIVNIQPKEGHSRSGDQRETDRRRDRKQYSVSVRQTLWVGDEPRDIVFAGEAQGRAFVTTAHRGQNSEDSPDLFAPSSGRADVWIFDAANPGTSPGGSRLGKLTFFADTPRALTVSPDGSRVYAAAYLSGNETTVVSADAVREVYADRLDPLDRSRMDFLGTIQPVTGRIVRFRPDPEGQSHWLDAEGSNFDDWVTLTLPDRDVFTIDALSDPPSALEGQDFSHVGTTLFNMAVNPASGRLYVSNLEAHNDVRFEGHNPSLPVTSVRGQVVDSRLTILDPADGSVQHYNLNLDLQGEPVSPELARAFPGDLTVSSDGTTLYVVAHGSAKLAVYDTEALESGMAVASEDNQALLSAGGPSGVVLDEAHGRAYVLTRFDNGISSIDLASRTEVEHRRMFNPEPASVTTGRRYLYDATDSSASGTQACASCHIGGDLDGLSWDLGNPGALPLPITTEAANDDVLFTAPPDAIIEVIPLSERLYEANPTLKGPMTTQSLRGLANHGAMHWRGDRNGAIQQNGEPFLDPATGTAVTSAQPDTGLFDEARAFESFNVAFPGLVGREEPLSQQAMADFRAFSLQLTYPPNPIRNLDNSLTSLQQTGRDLYFQADSNGEELPVDRIHNCNGCHVLAPEANLGHTPRPGFFGSDGRLSFENLPQLFKVAHFRNAYQKVGMFASSPDSNRVQTIFPNLNPPLPAVRGFGFQPDGAVGSIEHHLSGRVFIRTTFETLSQQGDLLPPNPFGLPFFLFDPETHEPVGLSEQGFGLRRALSAFLMAYDSNLKPITGQQVTVTEESALEAQVRLDLLEGQALAGACDLIVKGAFKHRERGFLFDGTKYRQDKGNRKRLSRKKLLKLIQTKTAALTFSCVPRGSGVRSGLDRDADGILDGDDR